MYNHRARQQTPRRAMCWPTHIRNRYLEERRLLYMERECPREYRLTPWGDDPVNDAGGEALYLRDEERGCVWSPTPLPCRGTTPYVTRHGFGYSVFEHTEHGISSELWVYVALDAAIKFSVLQRAQRLVALPPPFRHRIR